MTTVFKVDKERYMSETLPVSIRYSGKDVDDGSMEIGDVVAALNGFANAYTKVALFHKAEADHEIRITGIHKGSADVSLDVITALAANKDAIVAAGAALGIVKLILEVIKLTKHTRGEPATAAVASAEGAIIVKDSQGVQISVSKDVYNIYQEGLIRQDLSKIVEPLSAESVDSVKISAKDKKRSIEGEIKSSEKHLFGYNPKEATQTQEMILVGRMFSVNTEINRGSFRMTNGERVGYRLKVQVPEAMYRFVGKQLVRVKCIAHLDENLKPVYLDIFDVEPLQGQFDF